MSVLDWSWFRTILVIKRSRTGTGLWFIFRKLICLAITCGPDRTILGAYVLTLVILVLPLFDIFLTDRQTNIITKKCLEINMGLPNLADVFSFQLYVKILLFKAF